MKTTRFITSILVAGAIFTACEDSNKRDKMDMSSDTETEMEMSSDNMNSDMQAKDNEKSVVTREYAMKDGTEISYDYSDDGVTSLKDWDDYNTLSYEFGEIETVDFRATNERVMNMDALIANLGNSVPDWLKTEEVMEDVADIQKEYNELKAEKNASEDERKENLEELSEQFDDFREELNETINEYMKINEEAIEEYNEEIKKGKVEAANEEYDEEIKKKKKIADYKEQSNR